MNSAIDRVEMIRERIHLSLQPEHVDIEDDSAAHAGHAGAQSGGGHFNAIIVSPLFQDKSMIKRHRMVYKAMGDAMQTDIHALSIKAFTPEEYQALKP